MKQSIVDKYLSLLSVDTKYISKYYKQTGIECRILKLNQEKADRYLIAFGASSVDFSVDSEFYDFQGLAYLLIDQMDLATKANLADTQVEIYVPDLEITTGDVIEYSRNNKIFRYTLSNPMGYGEYVWKLTLTLLEVKDVTVQ